jgi:hypothetical protein
MCIKASMPTSSTEYTLDSSAATDRNRQEMTMASLSVVSLSRGIFRLSPGSAGRLC